jgi:hypothetical protein
MKGDEPMKCATLVLAALALLLSGVGQARAGFLTESFDVPFPAWQSGWLGTNSNLENYYVVYGSPDTFRGNNPDGLWVADQGPAHRGTVAITFNPAFGSTLTSFSIDIAGYLPINLEVFDMSHNVILNTPVVLTFGGTTNPGVYSHYSVNSTNGISGFAFVPPDQNYFVEGNTSIDNVSVFQGASSAVPEPSNLTLLGIGIAGIAGYGWRRRRLAAA